MSTLEKFAHAQPDKPAAIDANTGEHLTYARLHQESARLAVHLAHRYAQGEVVAVLLTNRLEYFVACIAARRAGLYYVPISTHLTPGELQYILRDSGARCLITEACFAALIERASETLEAPPTVLCVDGTGAGAPSYATVVQGDDFVPPLPERVRGIDFAYSSGTTGQPKGIKHALTGDKQMEAATRTASWVAFFALDANSVYLSPAPLYHAAPLRFCLRTLDGGGTVVYLRKFDAAGALAVIEKHRVTHSQWVPTMFVRLLALPPEQRGAYDLSSHRMAVHAAAPCPNDIKQRMLDWWGPIIWEYYTGSERAGTTLISPQEWQQRPGSVGRAEQGTAHILDAQWNECPTGVDGLVCFEGGPRFTYHNDPAKTADAYSPQGWATFGDVGHLDADGYLFLTDRRSNMIISGGVNIYPQEAENVLLAHPAVHDVAVIGVPHPDFGEEVKAIVELVEPGAAGDDMAATLMAHCRERLSHIKCPRSVVFATALPRTETGKLLKRLIRDEYRRAAASAAPLKPTQP
jgi:long-chain acyl-CoA synthetase